MPHPQLPTMHASFVPYILTLFHTVGYGFHAACIWPALHLCSSARMKDCAETGNLQSFSPPYPKAQNPGTRMVLQEHLLTMTERILLSILRTEALHCLI